MTSTPSFETSFAPIVQRALPAPLSGVVLFVLKHLWAALFAVLILGSVIFTNAIWNDAWPVARYDALFAIAVLTQVAMLFFKLETWDEAKVILLFHLTGTCMEWFKVNAGSWGYPEDAVFMVFNVPLFSGFMYASVGSYIARVIRLFDLRFTPYPPYWTTVVLAVAIYVNFFLHHYWYDIRLVLFAATLVLFWRTQVRFTVGRRLSVRLPLAALCASFALWIAENIGTLTGTWVYAGGAEFDWTPISKMGSWYLLIYVAFVTVTLVIRAPLDIKDSHDTTYKK
ncbi:DUF817 domain-containing protein [Octadecabacter sp. CECT 8868]|uniref:DUF817 domain-containing protein n=1 Tax=Octadecabacter algicola TaxID=2909342 RepID=UPI001F403BA5|nr:DUF817 domain-containing protein [Octadecabacter algicola]MCF2905298.1 DUF817 domain-containing protein [Octadecabacter algicola]